MHDDIYQMYLEEIALIPACDPQEEKELLARIRTGDEGAKQRLLEGSLGFIVELAKGYADKGLPLGDLVQEANIALILTADDYEDGEFRAQVAGRAKEMIEAAIAAMEAVIPENGEDLVR